MRRALLLLSLLIACSTPSPKPAETGQAPAKAPLIAGTIDLAESLKAQADPLAVLFVIARNSQGQIVAVKKLFPPFQYPVSFSLGEEDAMIQGTELSGNLMVSARLDKDGNANPPSPGDILAKADPKGFPVGSKDLKLVLNEAVK